MVEYCPKEFYKAGVVYNGVDTDAFRFDINKENKNYFTWVGKITKDKGLYEAILAVKKANEKLIFAGVMDSGSPENKEYFETKIKSHIDNDQIKFLGQANFQMKNDLMMNAKAFLNPIKWKEPFGMVTAESLASATPVISFANGAASELINNNVTGYLIPEDVDAMVEAIKKTDQLNRAECRKAAVERFSTEAIARDYLKIYEKVIIKNLSNRHSS